jgi:hypothetical protein
MQRRYAPGLSLSALASAFEDIGLGQTNLTEVGRPSRSHQNRATSDSTSNRPMMAPHQTTSSRHMEIGAQYEELHRLPSPQLVEELNAAVGKKNLDRSVVALYVFERRFRPGSGDEMAIAELPYGAFQSILKLVSMVGVIQIETSLPAELLEQRAAGCHHPRWLASLIESCMAYIAQNAHTFSFHENAHVLHTICLCEDFFFEEILSTMVDTIRLQMMPANALTEGVDLPSCTAENLSRALTSAILLAETITGQSRLLLPLLVQSENANSSPGRERHQYREMETVRMVNLLATADHPVVNQSFTTAVLLFIGSIFSELQSRGQVQPAIAPQSWFFLMRSLGRLPWLPEAAVSSMLPSLHVALSNNSSICQGVLYLLGREQVRSPNAPLALKVLELLTNDFKQSIVTRRRATSSSQRRFRCVEFTKLPTFLPLIHHMLKTNLKSLLPLGGEAQSKGGREMASIIQSAAKEMYTSLCDDLFASTASVNELCQAKLVDQVLHHFVCQAPKSLVHHPFVHHLVYAMSQTLPSLRFMSEASQGRLLAVIERLQEEDILNDMYHMPFHLIRKHPMLLSALEETLEFKRKSLLRRLKDDQSFGSSRGGRGGAEAADLPPYKDNPELIENNCSIAFVSLRKLVERSRAE